MLLLRSTADAQMNAGFVVSSTNALVVKTLSAASHRSRKVLPVTMIVKPKVCVKYMGGAHVSSPSERYVLSLLRLSVF